MNRKIRVLHVVSGLDFGGVGVLLYNYYINMNSNKVEFDFITHGKNGGYIEEKFKALGSKIYHITPKKDDIVKNIKEIKDVLYKERYDIIHVHQNHMSFIPLYLAKKVGVKTRIVHSHGFVKKMSIREKLKNNICTYFINKLANQYFCCSEEAGRWLYGNKIMNSNQYTLIKNAINLDKFRFNREFREKFRDKYKINNKLVLAQIGRFSPEKNHMFTIEVFKEINKRNINSILILIGNNQENERLLKKIDEYNLKKNILFLGKCENINEIMSAIDIVLLPSLHEGLGIVSIEAQAAGKRCLASTNCSREIELTPLIKLMDLDKGAVAWANEILNNTDDYECKSIDILRDAGYDVKIEAQKLLDIYLSYKNI